LSQAAVFAGWGAVLSNGYIDRETWFASVRAKLGWAWIAVTAIVIAASVAGLLDRVTLREEILVLVLAAVLGIPHGALDHWVARDVFAAEGDGRGWMIKFFAIYLGIGAAFAVIGWWFPVLAWIAFLLVSAAHFGAGDVRDESATSWKRHIDVAVAGGAIIMTPYLVYPQEVAKLFAWITFTVPEPWQQFATNSLVRISLPLLAVGWFAYTVFSGRTKPDETLRQPPLLLEVAVVMALFAAVKPLLAFSIYFALLHALRHTLVLASRLRTRDRWRDVIWVLLQGVPLTLLTVTGGGVLYWWITSSSSMIAGQPGIDIAGIVRTVFWLLAALTFPHMWITSRWERLRAKA
jgi:beta-carotene 15,15'-dioxygenase